MIIYKITCLINGKSYIGQTVKDLKSRWNQHISQVRYVGGNSNRKICRYLHTAIKKYGIQNFKIEILEVCSSLEELNKKEIEYIKNLNTLAPNGFNLNGGGNNRSVISEETRKLLSIKLSGKNNPMFGKKGSLKQKEWLKEFNKRPRSEQWIENCKKAQQLRASLGLNKGFVGKKSKDIIEKTRSKLLKTFKFKSPEGEVFLIKDIHVFAKKYGFVARCLRKAYQYKKKYKGWEPIYE